MEMTFRWYGPDDAVSLSHIRQIPHVRGIVSALYDVPPGEAWSQSAVNRLRAQIEDAGLRLSVIESIPISEAIKLGRPERDRHIDHFCRSVEHVGNAGVEVVCYNFMPVFDWARTQLDMPLPDGSTALSYDQSEEGAPTTLPGWDATYDTDELNALIEAYEGVTTTQLWENLAYFLERVVPVAETAGVRLAIHPDDPPWPVFGLPRIITSGDAFERVTKIVDRPANGLTLCTGSLGADPNQDVPAIAHNLADHIHFVHARNVAVKAPKQFHETAHPNGDVNLKAVLLALKEAGFEGPMRPDHGRMIWGETGRPGYGLYDRALGASYLEGIWEAA